MTRRRTGWVLALLGLLLAGCAPKNIRVRCDAHLQPINAPALAAAVKANMGEGRASGRATP